MHTRVFRHGRLLLLAALFTVLAQGRAGAAPLNLWTSTPDISAFFLNFTFNSDGGACGYGAEYTLGYCAQEAGISTIGLDAVGLGPDFTEFPVAYELVAAVDPLTGLLTGTGGFFSIGSYLTGTVEAFGYTLAGGAAVLEFIIDVTGGSLAPAFAAGLPGVCTNCLGVTGAIFDWGDWVFGPDPIVITSTDAITDQFPIPEPASLCLLGLGLFGLSAARRLRHAK